MANPTRREDPAHDILAAEEFVVPAPDPRLHREHAHDVLAAEEFVVPARDPSLHHGPVTLPDDPAGIAEPHDVLAAEEFAMPAPRGVGSGLRRGSGRSGPSGRVRLALGATLALVAVRRLSRRRRRRRRR